MHFEQLIYDFISLLKRFDYTLSGRDHTWKVLFPDKSGKWHYLFISKYRETFFIHYINGDNDSLEIELDKSVKIRDSAFGDARTFYPEEESIEVWVELILSAQRWMKKAEKDWIKTNKQILEEYPLNYRTGTVPASIIRASLSDIYRLDKELGKRKVKQFVKLVEDGYFYNMDHGTVDAMSASKFLEYCKIAYIAGARKDEQIDSDLSGREMYQRYADGRHEGLLDIDPDSEHEFADWIDGKHPKKSGGGHPWEIKRGGNTTHISLYVRRPSYYQKEKFVVELNGPALTRLAETVRMFLAIHQASLPITISNPESIRKRLLGQDNIGIVPVYSSQHRANQEFGEEEDVFDVLHYDNLGRYKRRITPFIRWESLPVLKLRDY